MKRLFLLAILTAAVQGAVVAEAASMKAKYIANCVKFSQRVNPQMRAAAAAQKQACSCICDKVQELGAAEEDLRTILKYTREYDFTAVPKRPTFQQILQAHVNVHKDILTTQESLEAFVQGMMSCAMEDL